MLKGTRETEVEKEKLIENYPPKRQKFVRMT